MINATITVRDVARLKRNALNVYPLVMKADKLQSKIEELNRELSLINQQIDATETGSRIITNGVNSIDLIKRTVVEVKGKDGSVSKISKYEPNESRLVLNDKGTYDVISPDPMSSVEVTEEPATENLDENYYSSL